MSLIVSGHQPDLLPYSGFFYKMAMADIFDLKIYDQFVDKGYQRRVKMRDQWASLPVLRGSSSLMPIIDKRIELDAPHVLVKTISGRYRNARYWKARGPAILDMVTDIHTDRLWQFNLELILGIRDFLGITTPVSISVPTEGKGSAGIVNGLRRYGTDVAYLSGTGAQGYMGDCQEFIDADIEVLWSRHQPITGDSILSVILDYEDPLSVVMREKSEELELV